MGISLCRVVPDFIIFALYRHKIAYSSKYKQTSTDPSLRTKKCVEVLELLDKGEEAVMSIRNFGEKSLDELRQKMKEKGFMQDENELE